MAGFFGVSYSKKADEKPPARLAFRRQSPEISSKGSSRGEAGGRADHAQDVAFGGRIKVDYRDQTEPRSWQTSPAQGGAISRDVFLSRRGKRHLDADLRIPQSLSIASMSLPAPPNG